MSSKYFQKQFEIQRQKKIRICLAVLANLLVLIGSLWWLVCHG